MAARYPEIKQYILEQIDNGTYQEGMKLPTEKEMTEKFGVSRMTVRRAYDDLIQDGVLIRRAGSSVLVSSQKIIRSTSKISVSTDADLRQKYRNLSVRVIDFKVIHNHPVAARFLHVQDEDLIQIKRVQYGDGVPIVYENLFLVKRMFTDFTKEDCNQSFQTLVSKHFKGDSHNHSSIVVEAVAATRKVSSLLQIPLNSPILQMTVSVGDNNGQMYYCGVNCYPGDSFSYQTM